MELVRLKEKLIFKNIVNLIILYLTLLHFNTNTERYFSIIMCCIIFNCNQL